MVQERVSSSRWRKLVKVRMSHADRPYPRSHPDSGGVPPEKYFPENLAVRGDGSVLITAFLQKELWCVPGPEPRAAVEPRPGAHL